jgi:Icc-related predicted phosphoesterase
MSENFMIAKDFIRHRVEKSSRSWESADLPAAGRVCSSSAVRDALARYQPMLGLHGHIHESRGEARIGRTLAINPGSEYSEGVLRGAIITLNRKEGGAWLSARRRLR